MKTEEEIEREANELVERSEHPKRVKIPKELAHQMVELAAERGVTVGELAVQIIEAELDRRGVTLTEDERRVAERAEVIIKARREASCGA